MKAISTTACVLAAAGLLASSAASAAAITWTTGPSFGGANGHLGILTNGTLVAAVDLGAPGSGPLTVDPGGLNITFTPVNSPFFTSTFDDTSFGFPNNIGDVGWKRIIETAEYSDGVVSAPTFLSGLTVGNTYQVRPEQLASACCIKHFGRMPMV